MTAPRFLALLLAQTILGQAEKLPVKIYTAADGLAHNAVNRIVRDSRGHLWFCTSEGLSRFDGYEFHNYGQRDGLPHRAINDVLETRGGQLWVATAGGLGLYQPKEPAKQRFRVYRFERDDGAWRVNVLFEDSQGRIWCGTGAGLFRVDQPSGQSQPVLRKIELGMPKEALSDQVVSALLEDPRGDLWVGAGSGLYRLRRDGAVERYTEQDGLPSSFLTALLQDRQHRIWAGTHDGLCQLVAEPAPGRRLVAATFREKDGLGADSITALHQLADGTLFVGTTVGLSAARIDDTGGSPSFSPYTASNGLPPSGVLALGEDIAGNLWIGTDGLGVAKLVWNTFLTYGAGEGLNGTRVESIFQDRGGDVSVIARQGSTDLYVNEFNGKRFRATRVNLPRGTRLLNWGARSQSVVHDEDGNWWIGTSEGLLHYDKVAHASDLARALPTARDGLPGQPVVSVFQDSGRNLWLSTTGKRNGIVRWDGRDGTFHSQSEGMPWLSAAGVSLFAEDGSGLLWMGLLRFGGGQPELARLRGATVELFGGAPDSPSGSIRALYLDRRKRLWVGTDQRGLLRFDHPESPQPEFRRYTTANGLSSDVILSLTEDTAGRIYAGNGSGVDRLDPATSQIQRYTSADGLAPGEVYASFQDREGVLWFGAAGGLSRLLSPPDHPPAPLRVAIASLRVSGAPQATAELGEVEISGLRFQPNQNDVEVSFVAPSFAPGEMLRYQYMLRGADSTWSQPSLQRSVHYANLPADSYRFLVRAINSEGIVSERPASLSFLILPPLWLRWWFQLPVAALVCAMIYWLHRYRVTRLLELERVRTRIASDLHDDIGSSLSQIAILSEVANRHIDSAHRQLAEPLTDIAGISRELVDSMSDIVWAIDPERDHLDDLVHRMRRFASDVLSPRDIRLQFQSAGEPDLPMGADLRRQIFLIFKEAINNALHHSGATEVRVEFRVEHRRLHLTIADNGRGFDVLGDHQGHGLRSMAARAREAGGTVEIRAGSQGTAVTAQVPVGGWTARRARSPHK